MNKRLNALVLLSALWGTSSVSAADVEDSARHDRDHPVAKLFDANGKFVGELEYFDVFGDPGAGVILNIHGTPVYAGITRIRLDQGEKSATEMEWAGNAAHFTGPNCSGTPYLSTVPPAVPLRPAAIVRNGAIATLYVASRGRQQWITAISAGGLWGTDCWDNYGGELRAWAVESTIDLTQRYPEPLRVGF
ncbi:hypothetical protein AWB67_04745 [Caballeronia terrestris]|uniref:Uncharacterized protein n=1 Tax=Caballeronia terrestris TaxID=1226301 RepID=A0A158K2Z9_9BURK|nr:hypothetical protein [Caballeronia terrestris]SAL75345.1 hypothetical protein AWB67_04745 [Caballeronia terrestris]